jgi:hypothetical protein
MATTEELTANTTFVKCARAGCSCAVPLAARFCGTYCKTQKQPGSMAKRACDCAHAACDDDEELP